MEDFALSERGGRREGGGGSFPFIHFPVLGLNNDEKIPT